MNPILFFEDVSELHNSSIRHINAINTGMHMLRQRRRLRQLGVCLIFIYRKVVKTDELSTLEYPIRRKQPRSGNDTSVSVPVREACISISGRLSSCGLKVGEDTLRSYIGSCGQSIWGNRRERKILYQIICDKSFTHTILYCPVVVYRISSNT